MKQRPDGPGVTPNDHRVGGLEGQQRGRVDDGMHRHAEPGSLEEEVQARRSRPGRARTAMSWLPKMVTPKRWIPLFGRNELN